MLRFSFFRVSAATHTVRCNRSRYCVGGGGCRAQASKFCFTVAAGMMMQRTASKPSREWTDTVVLTAGVFYEIAWEYTQRVYSLLGLPS